MSIWLKPCTRGEVLKLVSGYRNLLSKMIRISMIWLRFAYAILILYATMSHTGLMVSNARQIDNY